jgi:hypothetical protein
LTFQAWWLVQFRCQASHLLLKALLPKQLAGESKTCMGRHIENSIDLELKGMDPSLHGTTY